MSRKPNILQKKEAYIFEYQDAVDFAEKQRSIFWTPEEINVEKDVQDIKVNMTESESHGVLTTLKLFTLYEIRAGVDYWGGKIMNSFPRPDIQMMASAFSFFELNVHAPFYNKLNEALGVNTEDFYLSYHEDSTLEDRMINVANIIAGKERSYESLLMSIAGFSFVEGVVLYSAFAFLKHFQSQGKNKIINVVSGINFSIRDEAIHAEGGAWLFRTLISELKQTKKKIDHIKLKDKIVKTAQTLRDNEHYIVDMLFEKGSIKGITSKQLKNFIDSRVDLGLQNLGYEKIYNIQYNPIAEWFYDAITTVQFHDFFAKTGNEYNRDWDEKKFLW